MKNFIEFIREQGVVGLAVGFILGGSIKEVISALVDDIVNPLLGVVLGFNEGLSYATIKLGPAQVAYGHFVSAVIDFLVIALVVYTTVKVMKLDRLDKKKK